MNTALQIAQYIYNKGYADNLQINKLLYISFGFYGAKHKKYLFDDPIEAWKYGPVIPIVYTTYKNGILDVANPVTINIQQEQTIDHVLNIYGKKAPFLLVELTHQKNTPWSNAYIKGQRNIEINKDDIISYYTNFLNKTDQIVKRFDNETFKKVMENLAKT